jgi:hypothetical protein
MVPKERKRNIKARMDIITWGGESEENAATLWKMCSEDILFYLNLFVLTYDPRLTNTPAVPFNTYPFQDRFILDMVDALGNEDLLLEKSRDMRFVDLHYGHGMAVPLQSYAELPVCQP